MGEAPIAAQSYIYRSDRSNIPLTLIDLDSLADLVKQHYESFDSDGRGLLPLTKIYWPSE